jgi:ADP-ribose pyrophosphatase
MPDRVVAETRFLRLMDRDGWFFVQRPNATGVAVILAVTDDGRLLLVEQHRPALGGSVIELPAGLAGDHEAHAGEELETAARRELLEETGYSCAQMEPLVTCASAPGLASEVMTLFRARGLRKEGPGGGVAEEGIVVHEVPLAEVPAWLEARSRAGAIVAIKVYAGLFFAGPPPGQAR